MKKTTPRTDEPMNAAEVVQPSQPAAAPAASVPGGISPERAADNRRNVAASPGVQTPGEATSPDGLLRVEEQDLSPFATLIKRVVHHAIVQQESSQQGPPETTGAAARDAQLLAAILAWQAEPEGSWQRDAKLRELEKLPQKWNEQLGRQLAAAAPFANERAGMFGDIELHLYKEIGDLSDQALTGPEQMRLLKLITKLEHSGRRTVMNFYEKQARAFLKKRKKK